MTPDVELYQSRGGVLFLRHDGRAVSVPHPRIRAGAIFADDAREMARPPEAAVDLPGLRRVSGGILPTDALLAVYLPGCAEVLLKCPVQSPLAWRYLALDEVDEPRAAHPTRLEWWLSLLGVAVVATCFFLAAVLA